MLRDVHHWNIMTSLVFTTVVRGGPFSGAVLTQSTGSKQLYGEGDWKHQSLSPRQHSSSPLLHLLLTPASSLCSGHHAIGDQATSSHDELGLFLSAKLTNYNFLAMLLESHPVRFVGRGRRYVTHVVWACSFPDRVTEQACLVHAGPV